MADDNYILTHVYIHTHSSLPKFWMTNKPQNEAQRYGVCWGELEIWSSERDFASQKILKTIKPERISNPQGREIGTVIQKLKSAATGLEENGKFVSVVISTQGIPSDTFTESNSAVMEEYIQSLRALSALPVKIVFRLCTDDKKGRNFYKKIDMDIDCDVLGSYWDEVRHTYTYLCCVYEFNVLP
jgi:hypothetical protein